MTHVVRFPIHLLGMNCFFAGLNDNFETLVTFFLQRQSQQLALRRLSSFTNQGRLKACQQQAASCILCVLSSSLDFISGSHVRRQPSQLAPQELPLFLIFVEMEFVNRKSFVYQRRMHDINFFFPFCDLCFMSMNSEYLYVHTTAQLSDHILVQY